MNICKWYGSEGAYLKMVYTPSQSIPAPLPSAFPYLILKHILSSYIPSCRLCKPPTAFEIHARMRRREKEWFDIQGQYFGDEFSSSLSRREFFRGAFQEVLNEKTRVSSYNYDSNPSFDHLGTLAVGWAMKRRRFHRALRCRLPLDDSPRHAATKLVSNP